MAKPRMDLSAFVGKLLEEQDGDVLREGIRVLSQALMETEVAGLIGADRHERSGHRNGYRMRTWDTRVGTIELAIGHRDAAETIVGIQLGRILGAQRTKGLFRFGGLA